MSDIAGDLNNQRFWIITKGLAIFGPLEFHYSYDSATLHVNVFCFSTSLILEHVFSEIKIYQYTLHIEVTVIFVITSHTYTHTNHSNSVPKLAKKKERERNKIWCKFYKKVIFDTSVF